MPTALRALFLLGFAVAGCDVPVRTDAPEAKGGVMDLSRWDFETQGPVALRGEWMFRYGALIGRCALTPGVAPSPPRMKVPSPGTRVAQHRSECFGAEAGEGGATRRHVRTTGVPTRGLRRPWP